MFPLRVFEKWQVHYIANSGSTWGEHEIDYVFLIQADVDLDPNPNEACTAQIWTLFVHE